MRVLVLTALTVVAVIYHGSQAVAGENSNSLIGRALLRRALEALSSKPGQINIKRRSIEENNDDDETKTKEVLEDIFGSGSQEASGSSPSDLNQSSDVQSDVQSGSGSAAEQTVNSEDTETESSAQNSDEQAPTADQQQEDANQETDSGSASTSSTTADQTSQQTEQSTVQVADKATPNEPIAVAKSTDEDASKKSDIELASGEEASTREQENNDESSSSGDSDEVTSGQVADDEHDDGSAEAIRKGMESLSRLLKPVATTLDLQVYSGSAKPKEDEDEEEEQKAVIKEEAKGESDKEEKKDEEEKEKYKEEKYKEEKDKEEKDKEEKDKEEKDEEEKEEEEKDEEKEPPPKVKKCETVCKAPMTYQQCAVPRCSQKMGTIKDLCFFLCEHQKPHCRQVCKEV